jgi:Flp pilus assembly pilin Flp
MYVTTPGPLNYAEANVRLRMAKASRMAQDGERGASAIEWVIISAILIVIVGAVGTIILGKLTEKADSLELNP